MSGVSAAPSRSDAATHRNVYDGIEHRDRAVGLERDGGLDFIVRRLGEHGFRPALERPGKYRAFCPAHPDRVPSLTVDASPSGRAILKCWAGCDDEDVRAALGLTLRDLYPPHMQTGRARGAVRDFAAMAVRMRTELVGDRAFWSEHAAPMGWTAEAAKALGIGLDGERFSFPERDADGAVVTVSYRVPDALRGEGRTKDCEWGGRRGMVFEPEAIASADIVHIVEGAPCAMAMASMGYATVGLPSAGMFSAAWTELFVGKTVILLPDCDTPGRTGFAEAAKAIVRVAGHVELIDLAPDLEDGFDVADLLSERAWESAKVTIEQATHERATKVERIGPGRPRKESIEAEDFLRRVLADGRVPSDDVRRMRKAAGIRATVFKEAKKAVGAESIKTGRVWSIGIPSSEAERTIGISTTGYPEFPTS